MFIAGLDDGGLDGDSGDDDDSDDLGGQED